MSRPSFPHCHATNFSHGLVDRSIDLCGAEGAVLRHIVGEGNIVAHLLRVLDRDLVRQRPHRVIVAGGKDGILDLRGSDGAVVHEDIETTAPSLGLFATTSAILVLTCLAK